jgi:hypothetical protein
LTVYDQHTDKDGVEHEREERDDIRPIRGVGPINRAQATRGGKEKPNGRVTPAQDGLLQLLASCSGRRWP